MVAHGLPPPPPGAAGVYLHFPFCALRCSYCDFPTVAGQDALVGDYLDALERELRSFQTELPSAVDSVYFGGGTPSRMEPRQVARLLAAVRRRFDVAADAEVTLEGNPESLTEERLRGFSAAGVTRVSVGVQSLDDGALARARRPHDAAAALAAVRRAREAPGLEINVDLIAGLPGEDLRRWESTIDRLAGLGIDHLSLYLLETDKDSPLGRAVRAGRSAAPDDDRLAAVYERSVERLEGHGLRQYEIANFARAGRISRHNVKYWTDGWYGGFGLGAHGYAAGRRRANLRELARYLAALRDGRDPLEREEPWDPLRRLEEALILGLRLARGVDLDRLGHRYGVELEAKLAPVWSAAEGHGLVVREGPRVRLTPTGRLRSNALFVELLEGLAAGSGPGGRRWAAVS